MDATTTEFTTISALDSASTTENLWTSTTVVSCPVYSNLLDDPSFEGKNNAPNRWELKLQFDGTAVTYQKQSSNSQDVPRAHSGDQFVLLGTDVGTDMRRVVSLDKKKYQLWITYAAISDPDEDWVFNFIVATRNGHAFRQLTNVPKGEPFVYREERTVFQGWKDDFIQPFVRLNSSSKPRLVAIDDIYVADYLILLSRQGKVRLAKWFSTLSPKDKAKIVKDVSQLVLARRTRMCNFLEYKDTKIVYRRYASLFFIAGCSSDDNELITLEIIHRYVEQMDKYYGNVCELDIIFSFTKAYYILDEILLAGELQETSKKNILRCIGQQDSLEDMEPGDLHPNYPTSPQAS
ncbi:hypothetical protein FAUST_3820 [Fusarium austroamericanum]|uniref:AP-1 complex subunit sigma-1 n=1 Tax=Fusarium austroamericanum TaxID=282268 RepID=A0AAN6HHH3_FUSAU|nr:hypothetical protein FAUST_3820 [Fusarium austroamericanum]